MDSLIFSGRSNPDLANKICEILRKTEEIDIKGDVDIINFPSNEIYCKYKDNIRGKNIFIVQSTNNPNEDWMELFLMVHTARLASANKITAIVPYFSYSRQDRKTEPRSPISAKLILDLLEKSGVNRIITVDIHNHCIQGFSSVPLDSLIPSNLWLDYVMSNFIKTEKDINKWVLASVDIGGAKKVKKYGEILNMDFCITHKHRVNATKVTTRGVMGDVKDKNVIIIDDMSESLNSLLQCSEILKKDGAKKIYAFITHLPLTPTGIKNLEKVKHINKIITTDTVGKIVKHKKVKVLSVANLLAQAIECTMKNKSISKLFSITGF